MSHKTPRLLLHGPDTVQCCYYLAPRGDDVLDFVAIQAERDRLRAAGTNDAAPIMLGSREFLLSPRGSSSGYPIVINDGDYRIEFGRHNNPPFFVTFRSAALWRSSMQELHENFLDWARSVGYQPVKPESMTRVDYCFDYSLDIVDFDEDCFVTLSSKDAQHRENGRIQTLSFGKGGVVLRVYDKVAEIEQQSGKVWFYYLWAQDKNVWRIEWQARKEVLRRFGIRTFADLHGRYKPLLEYLANEHDTLRVRNEDTNRSRWPLHPLWRDLQRQIDQMEGIRETKGADPTVVLEYRLMQIGISVCGYLKRMGAIRCVQTDRDSITIEEALQLLEKLVRRTHTCLNWVVDVEKRIKEIRLGDW